MSESRISSIERLVADQNQILKAGLKKRIWITAGLAVFVVLYMSFLTVTVSRTVTPDSVSDVVVGVMAQNAPIVRDRLVGAAEKAMPGMVEHGVGQVYEVLPQVRRLLVAQVDTLVPELPPEFYEMLARDLELYFARNREVLESLLARIESPEQRAGLIREIAATVRRDLRMYLDEVALETAKLQTELNTLFTTDDRELTPEQRKVKEILIYYLYLVKNQEVEKIGG